mgnify:CR=1
MLYANILVDRLSYKQNFYFVLLIFCLQAIVVILGEVAQSNFSKARYFLKH